MLYGIHTVAGLENFLCTRKAYHAWFFQTSLILKARCLPLDNLVQKLILCPKVIMYLEVFLWTDGKNWKVPIWFKKKINKNFRVFDFALYPRSKIRKSRKFRLPQIMTLIVIQDLKAPKKSIEAKIKRFQYDLEQKEKFPRFPSFRFCSIPRIENSEISENSLLIQILTV